MAGTISYDFDPGQDVYVIEQIECSSDNKEGLAVHPGKVIRVHSEVLVNSTGADNLRYDVRIQGRSGTLELEQSDVFATKAAAITDYQTRIQ